MLNLKQEDRVANHIIKKLKPHYFSHMKGWVFCFTDLELKRQCCVCVNILLQ